MLATHTEEWKQAILTEFLDIIQVVMKFEEIEEVAEWKDGTLEITVNGEGTDTFYYRAGLFYTPIAIPPMSEKTYIKICDEGSLCVKGCGCNCIIDRGYMSPSNEIAADAEHCKEW